MRPAIWTLAVVSGLFGLLFLLERAFPLRRRSRSFLARLLVNLTMSALAFLVAAMVVRPAAMGSLNWSAEKPFGLAHFLQLPAAAQFILSFLWMDLTFYWWHIANHRI